MYELAIPSLEQVVLGHTVGAWLIAGATALAFMAAVRAAMWLARGYAKRVTARTETEVDDLVVDMLEGTKFFLVAAVAVYVGALPLELSAETMDVLSAIAAVAFFVQAALWGSQGLSFWFDRYGQRRAAEDPAARTSIAVMAVVAKVALWILVLVLALDNMGFDVTALVTGLGIGGLAVALALQSVLKDLFASMSIVLDKPYSLGDFLRVGDFLGTVEHIGIKTTRLRANTGEQVVFNNSDLLESRIRNYGRMTERRGTFLIGVTYDTPAEQLESIPTMIRKVVEAQPETRFDRCHFKEFGDSALVYETVYFKTVPDYVAYMDTQQAINLELVRRFEAEGIEFAYPTQTLFVHPADASDD